MISDLCDRDDHGACFDDETDGCRCDCHPTDCPAGKARLTTKYTGTGRAAYPADGLSPAVQVRAASAVVRSGPAVPQAPHGTAGGKKSPQLRRERAAAGTPGPETGAGGRRTGSSAPVRVRSNTPAGGAPSANADGSSAFLAGSTGRTFTVILPAGLKMLNLNQRLHWAEERRRAREIKKAAWAVALCDKLPRLGRVSVVAEYQPPDRRHRDGDNIAAAAKHALDGIVAAGCLPGDDRRYVAGTYCTIGEPYPKGRLVLHLTEIEAATGGAA